MTTRDDPLGDTAATAPCSLCGGPMGVLSDDQPDWPGGPMCGDCYQAQQADDETFWDELDEDANA